MLMCQFHERESAYKAWVGGGGGGEREFQLTFYNSSNSRASKQQKGAPILPDPPVQHRRHSILKNNIHMSCDYHVTGTQYLPQLLSIFPNLALKGFSTQKVLHLHFLVIGSQNPCPEQCRWQTSKTKTHTRTQGK